MKMGLTLPRSTERGVHSASVHYLDLCKTRVAWGNDGWRSGMNSALRPLPRSAAKAIFRSDDILQAAPQTMKMARDPDQGPGRRSGDKPQSTPNTRKEEGRVFISFSVCSVYSVVNSGPFLGQSSCDAAWRRKPRKWSENENENDSEAFRLCVLGALGGIFRSAVKGDFDSRVRWAPTRPNKDCLRGALG